MRVLSCKIQQWIWLCCGCILLFATPVHAGTDLRWSGRVESNLFLGLRNVEGGVQNRGNYFDYWNSNSLFLKINPKVGEHLEAVAEIQLRNINFSKARLATDIENYNNNFPVSVRLWEAYIDFFGLTEWFDLRVGQQRIAWGSGVGFNPTDNINPYNLENPIDFTSRLPVPAIKATFSSEELFTLTLVWAPFFTAPVLPITQFKEVFELDFPLAVPDPFTYKTTEYLELPAYSVSNSVAAAKMSFEFGNTNLSLSYTYGHLWIPVPTVANIVQIQTELPIDVTLAFPRAHIPGFDLKTTIGSVDVWIEAALFIPTERTNIDVQSGGKSLKVNPLDQKPLPTVVAQSDTPFPKIVAGLAYTFPGGWYVNLQYLYGFFNEQALDKLHHYAMLVVRKPFLRDRLLLQATFGYEVDATNTAGPNKDGQQLGMAFLANPELHIKPFDASAIVLGAVFARGSRGTSFVLFEELDQVYLRVKMNF